MKTNYLGWTFMFRVGSENFPHQNVYETRNEAEIEANRFRERNNGISKTDIYAVAISPEVFKDEKTRL